MSRLENKTALITGATSGIGLVTAQRFLQEGARVAITGIDPTGLEEAQKSLGGGVLTLRADAGDIGAQGEVARAISDKFGRLDIVFLNAGIAPFKPLEAWTETDFDRAFSINLKGPFFLIKALLPLFSNPASIILSGSINARMGKPYSSVYAATKAAMVSLARTLSGELIGRGIRANAISPGPIATPIYDKLGVSGADLDRMKSGLTANILAGRFGEPKEIADAAVYLASDESRFTVGAELIVDGGMTVE